MIEEKKKRRYYKVRVADENKMRTRHKTEIYMADLYYVYGNSTADGVLQCPR